MFCQVNSDLPIDGVAEGVDDSPEDPSTDWDIDNGPRPLNDVPLLDQLVVTKHHHTNVVRLEIQSHTLHGEKTISLSLSLSLSFHL